MEQINKLIDDCIQRYSRTLRIIPLEVVDDFKKLKKMLEEMNTVDIKEIKEEKKEIIQEPTQEVKEEIKPEETIEEVRDRYEQKMQKKPFMWWDKQTLYTKMWE